MLSLKNTLRSNRELQAALVAAGVGFTALKLWQIIAKRRELEAKWKKIYDVREKEAAFREKLKEKLQGEAEKHKGITELSFKELVEKLQSDQLSAVEVLHAFQYSALVATEKTNCVATYVYDAEERAVELDAMPKDQPKKPLHGIPVSLKENFLLEGTEATSGLGSVLGQFKHAGTAPVVQFLIDQGCVPFCKTNLPQALLTFDSRNPIYGMTKNPNDLTRGPGGSSSGEGALLAQRGSILGVGSDMAGSTRISPAWCGACSLKPTSQRMLSYRGGAEVGSEGTNRVMPHDIATYGFMARDEYTLSIVHKLFYSDSTFEKNPEFAPVSFRDEIFNSQKPLTIGYYYSLPNTVEAVPSMKRGVKLAKEALEKCGHKLVEFHPPKSRQATLLLLQALVADGGLDTIKRLRADVEISFQNKRSGTASWPKWFRYLVAMCIGKAIGAFPIEMLLATVPVDTPHGLNLVLRKIKDYRKEVLDSMEAAGIDALVGPAFATPACLLDDPRDIVGAIVYTGIYSLLNWPAGVLPVTKVTQADENAMAAYPEIDMYHRVIKKGQSSNSVGLPVAVQIATKPYTEEVSLRLMRDVASSLSN